MEAAFSSFAASGGGCFVSTAAGAEGESIVKGDVVVNGETDFGADAEVESVTKGSGFFAGGGVVVNGETDEGVSVNGETEEEVEASEKGDSVKGETGLDAGGGAARFLRKFNA